MAPEPYDTLRTLQGKAYWRSLEELAQTDAFRDLVEREFSGPPGGWTDPVNRRRFLFLAAASLGLAGLSGCAPAPAERILPYVRAPQGLTPGRSQFYATALPVPGDALGLLVQTHDGRPTKIEGNPDHPACPKPEDSPQAQAFGPTDAFAQASLLSLYDPDRSTSVTHLGDINTWDHFTAELRRTLDRLGAAVRIAVLTESITSPSLAHQLHLLTTRYPQARWFSDEPVGRLNVDQGAELAFGQRADVQLRLNRADVIVALDADFLSEGPGHVRHLRDFAARRRVRQGHTTHFNRLYAVESMPTGTGGAADHRLALRSADILPFARALAARLDARFRDLGAGEVQGVSPAWLDALAADLLRSRGRSLLLAGPRQPAGLHALVHALNDFLGNAGTSLFYTQPVVIPAASGGLRELVEAADAGQVDVLLILGGNPAYTAPVDLNFADRIRRVPLRVRLGQYEDETSGLCHWHLPEAHPLESWGDARSHDGTVSLIQPLIAPLHGGRTAWEVLGLLTDQGEVQAYWRGLFDRRAPDARHAAWERMGLLQAFTGDFESWWRRTLHNGFAANTQSPVQSVSLCPGWRQAAASAGAPAAGLELNFRTDPTVYDGRYANNGWLQELPKPASKLTWDNAIYLSPATAVRLGLARSEAPAEANERVVALSYRGRTVEGPVWVQPGHADEAVTVHLGYGRRRAGHVGTGLGFDAFALRTASAEWFDGGAELQATRRHHPLACTQGHHLMENRDLVRSGTASAPPAYPHRVPLSLYGEPPQPRTGNQWGMVIDLSLCTGCTACVVACQAENNIPVVGKAEVLRGHEMHWLRIDRYFAGDLAAPEMVFQPIPCMHCEHAPCELVCPVEATVHSSDGLNDMVYNRCVGTRYCSNNCPYKVRRFNFLEYADFHTPAWQPMRNPEVTVRSRGVMEKCTYCVQRIRAGQIEAQLQDRGIRDGEVVTACQSACPAGAIVFGDLNDRDRQGRPRSEVARRQSEPHNYGLLEELNTRPRTTYLASLKNPNPEIAALERT